MSKDDNESLAESSGAMSSERLREFLASISVCSVASLRRSGAPFVIPLGFAHHGNSLYLVIRGDRSAITRMRHDDRVCITVYDDKFPPSWVVIEGRAREVADPDPALKREISTRFLGPQGIDVEEYLNFSGEYPRIVFEVPMERVRSMDGQKLAASGSLHEVRKLYDAALKN